MKTHPAIFAALALNLLLLGGCVSAKSREVLHTQALMSARYVQLMEAGQTSPTLDQAMVRGQANEIQALDLEVNGNGSTARSGANASLAPVTGN